MVKKWIKSAINPEHKGDFKAKAEKAGEPTRQFADEHASDSGKLGKQARLAKALMGMHKKKKPATKAMMAKRYGKEKD